MNKKLIAFTIIVLLLINVLGFNTFAEDVAQTEVASESASTTVENTAKYVDFITKVEAYASTGYKPSVVYTSDSVAFEGIMLEPYTDTLKFETGFIIKTDLDLGLELYDDPSTDIIEGIRVNGQEITSYIVPIDLDNPQNYIVDVRLVYSEGLTGTLAKISDGQFDWDTLMQEPLILMQFAYYVLAAISVIIGGLGAASSKKKKVRTADEIATKVDERVREGCTAVVTEYSKILKENLLPVFHTMVDTNKAVVKAMALSTSKNKEAPVALLDLLKNVSDVDVEQTIDAAKEEVLKNIANTEAKREAVHDALTRIANGTYQEVHDVQEHTQLSEIKSEPENVEETSEESETKSVF